MIDEGIVDNWYIISFLLLVMERRQDQVEHEFEVYTRRLHSAIVLESLSEFEMAALFCLVV